MSGRAVIAAGAVAVSTAVLAAAAAPAATGAPRAGHVAVRPAVQRGVVVTAIGDLILGNTPQLPAHPRHYLRGIRPVLTKHADVVFANLEGVLTTATSNKCGGGSGGSCFAFRNPPSFANAFADVRFTVVNSANNHSHDYFSAGVQQTSRALGAAGVAQTGVKSHHTYLRAGGHRVAVLGFAPYAETPNLLDLRHAAAMIHTAHKRAAIVVVYMHAGAEGTGADHVTGHEEYAFGEDRGNPEKFAHRAIRAGADLVLASGPHVLRGMEFYRGHLIAYSLGDSANYHNFDRSGTLADSAVLRVSLGPHGAFRSGRLVSVRLVDPGRPVRGGGSVAFVRRLSKEDFGSHAARLAKDGTIRAPR